MLLDLDPTTRLELASMVYSRWATAFDSLKAAKAMTWESQGKFCPKADWPSFHASILADAQKEFTLATKLTEDICKFSPLIAGE